MEEREWLAYLSGFETHLKAEKDLAALTVRNYKADLQPLFEYIRLKQLSGPRALDRRILRGYLAWLVELGYVRSSIVRKISALRSFIRWLLREKVISTDPLPARGVMKRDRRLPRFRPVLPEECRAPG